MNRFGRFNSRDKSEAQHEVKFALLRARGYLLSKRNECDAAANRLKSFPGFSCTYVDLNCRPCSVKSFVCILEADSTPTRFRHFSTCRDANHLQIPALDLNCHSCTSTPLAGFGVTTEDRENATIEQRGRRIIARRSRSARPGGFRYISRLLNHTALTCSHFFQPV
jgi:hypothetical protein